MGRPTVVAPYFTQADHQPQLLAMNDANQLGDTISVPPLNIGTSKNTDPVERPGRLRGIKFRRFLGKVTNGVIKKITRSNLKDSRSRHDLVPPNVECEGVSSIPNIEVQDAPTSAEQGANPHSALQAAKEAVKLMKPLSGPVTSGISAAQNAPADLDDACDFEETYLKPLKIFDSVIGKLADVHPYAKIALGILSCASKMVIAQSDRDQTVHRLVEKLDQVYGFMIQEETINEISSMRGILGQISQQTLECARFIR
ncbi:hypothetical protein BDR07DRAFT_1463660, partial [Suillus spraguei]